MICPKALVPGDKIRIVSPAGKVDVKFVRGAAERLQLLGFQVEIAPNALSSNHKFAGTDDERFHDLQTAMDDSSVSAILCSRGGYGSMRIVDGLDWSGMKSHPKFIIGFSDITTLHAAAYQHGICSVHACMSKDIALNDEVAIDALLALISRNSSNLAAKPHGLNRIGSADGQLVGGNLSMLYALRGTDYDVDWNGKVLFVEDLCEDLYHVDRIMQNFRLGGKLNSLAGLVVGQFSDMTDVEFGKSACEIIQEAVDGYDFPIMFDAPIGHIFENRALLHGGIYRLQVTKNGSELSLLA